MLVVAFLFNSCRNPAYELNVIYDAQVITYKATIELVDASGAPLPDNIDVTVTGTDAGSIYDFSGTKKIYAPAGIITVGVHPKEIPTAAKPALNFNLVVKIPGYVEKLLPLTINLNQFSQGIKGVTMVKVVVPSPATAVVVRDIPLSTTGATTTTTTFGTTTSTNVPQTTAITVPAGVTFKDAAGNNIVGGTLTAQAVNYDAADPGFAALFPGGDLKAPNVVLPNGQTSSAFFYPAGYTEVNMYVGGVEVRNFSTPITIAMQLDPTFVAPGSALPVKAGDQLGVYSYQVSTGQFKFETNATVVDVAGKPTLSFTTNHLTGFFAGVVVATPGCLDPIATIVAPDYPAGVSTTITLSAVNNTTRIYSEKDYTLSNGATVRFDNLPPSPVAYTIKRTSDGLVLAAGQILDPCAGAPLNITLPPPSSPLTIVKLNLNVVCPGKTFVVPNFDLFYKVTGSTEDFKFLATASGGKIFTTDLKVGTRYDFRATWGSRVKSVGSRLIETADMSTTVDQAGFLGNTQIDANRALLIQACSELP